jgi:transcriptional regulator with XRE-family HTH domain
MPELQSSACLLVAGKSVEYASFVRRLREARERSGLSQEEAARRLGRGQSFVSKCESGERRVDIVELKAFAKIYLVPMSFFTD